jgi:hypothetical protein
MNMITSEALFRNAIMDVLRESFHGAGDHGAFLDPGPNGLLAILKSLSAEEASLPIAGASIATHAIHIAFSLDVFNEWIQGIRDTEHSWDKSWEKHEVSTAEWDCLLSQIDRQFLQLERTILQYDEYDAEAVWGSIGTLAHTAFHLGIIQVKADELRKKDT